MMGDDRLVADLVALEERALMKRLNGLSRRQLVALRRREQSGESPRPRVLDAIYRRLGY